MIDLFIDHLFRAGGYGQYTSQAPAPAAAPSQNPEELQRIIAQVFALTPEQIQAMPPATQQQVHAMRQQYGGYRPG